MKPLLALLLCVSISAPAWSQRTAPSSAPTRHVVRKLPGPSGPRPLLPLAQEPAAGDLDADAAAVFRPRANIEPADVVLSNGEVRLERLDLFILGRAGLNFELRRRYRSRLEYKGPLGHGWDFNYNERLFNGPGGSKIRLNGSGHVDIWSRNGDGSFNAPAGFFGTLVANADGTFTLREPDGRKHHYRRKGLLFALEDRHGNRMSFQHVEGRLTSVTDVFGRVIRFFFEPSPDGRQRLARVRDFTGREILYTYDDDGDLVAARSPITVGTNTGNDFPNGTTERYSYHADHNLHEVTFPNEVAVGGPPAMAYAYDDEDRVTSWMLGGTNASGVPAGGTATFTYEALNTGDPLGDPTLARLRTTVVERNGNSYDVDINEHQHRIQSRRFTRGLRPGEPAFYLTRWEHDADGQLTRLIRPRGNGELRVYDSSGPRAAQRDLLLRRRVQDAVTFGGPDEDIVWTYAYDPVYHQLVSITDPRENSATFVPPIGSNAPGRYTTRRFLDYQEGSDPIPDVVAYGIALGSFPRGLGDLNADGRTDQVAGNVVRREDPSVQLEPGSPMALALGSTTQEIVTETWWNDFGQRIGEIDPEGNLTEWSYHSGSDPAGRTSGPQPLGMLEGGYLSLITRDSNITYRRTTGEGPRSLTTGFVSNERGAVTATIDARGVRHDSERNAEDFVIRGIRGADISQAGATVFVVDGIAFEHKTDTIRDANGNIIAIRKENPAAVSATEGIGDWLDLSIGHDILNNPIEETQEVDATVSAVTRRTYDASDNPTGVTYPEANEDRVEIDERHFPYQRTLGFGSPVAGTTMYGYDDDGYLRDITDPEDTDGDGQRETLEIDHPWTGWMQELSGALGHSTRATHDPAGNQTAVVEYGHPVGDTTGTPVLVAEAHYEFDEQNRMTTSTELRFVPAGTTTARPVDVGDGDRTTKYQYDANGDLRFVTDDRNWTLELTYDGARRLRSETDALGNVVLYERDGNGNVTCRTETDVQPEGLFANETYATTFTYDQLGREVRRIDSGGSTIYSAWDALDNIRATWDARGPLLPADPWGVYPKSGQTGSMNDRGNLVALSYNGLGLKIRAEYHLNEAGEAANGPDADNPFNSDAVSTNLYGFDLNGRQTSQTDDVGNTTRWSYSARNWITDNVLATGATISMTHDLEGNVRTQTWPNGFAVSNAYDARGRKISETRTAHPTGRDAGVHMKTFGYNGIDEVVAGGSYTTSSSPPPPTVVLTDTAAYDSLGQRVEETLHGSLTTSTFFDGVGNATEITLADGRVISLNFDPLNRARDLHCSVNGPIVSATYYFGRGLRAPMVEYGNGTVQVNGFDARRQPISVQHRLPPSAGSTEFVYNQWTRTRSGHIDSEQRMVSGMDRMWEIGSTGALDAETNSGLRQAFLRNGVGILRREDLGGFPLDYNVDRLGAVTSADGSSQGRDALGNQTTRAFLTFDWNHDNQLIYVEHLFNGGLKELIYLADGRLGMNVQPIFGQVTFRRMSWAPTGRIAQEYLDENGTLTLSRTFYYHNDKLVATDSEATRITSDQVTLQHPDDRSGTQASTWLNRADYMSNGFWDFNHTDTTGGGLELNTFPTLDQRGVWGWRYDRNLQTAHTNDRGDVIHHDTHRLGGRNAWEPGAMGRQRELGNGYTAFASGNPVTTSASIIDPSAIMGHLWEDSTNRGLGRMQSGSTCGGAPFVLREDAQRLFAGRTFQIDRLDPFVCFGTVQPHLGNDPWNTEFMSAIQAGFTEFDDPQIGDVLVLDADSGGSHTAFVTEVRDGRIGTIGKGSSVAPIELFDARDFGDASMPVTRDTLSFFRRNGRPLGAPLRTAISELHRVAKTLDTRAATPFVDHLIHLLQRHNAPGR